MNKSVTIAELEKLTYHYEALLLKDLTTLKASLNGDTINLPVEIRSKMSVYDGLVSSYKDCLLTLTLKLKELIEHHTPSPEPGSVYFDWLEKVAQEVALLSEWKKVVDFWAAETKEAFRVQKGPVKVSRH